MRLRALAMTSGAAALAFAGVLAGGGPAAAGGNGQQIDFYDSKGVVWSIAIQGYNQNGDWLTACFATPHSDNPISGWWWKGDVKIMYFNTINGNHDTNCGSNPRGSSPVYVPASQSGDWVRFDDAGATIQPGT